MRNVAVWRTSFEDTSLAAVFTDGVTESAVPADEFSALKAYFMKTVPEGRQRENALQRIEKLNPDKVGPEASETQVLEKVRVADKATYQQALRDELKSLACSRDESAPYIVRGLATPAGSIPASRIAAAGPLALDLIESILAPACPVSAALTEQDKANLKKLAKEAKASESKQ